MQWSDGIREFGFDCKVRKLSPKTIDNYSKQLRYFQKYLQSEFDLVEIEQVKAYHIKQFLAWMPVHLRFFSGEPFGISGKTFDKGGFPMKQSIGSRVLLLLSAFFALLGGALAAFPKNFIWISRFYANYRLDSTVDIETSLFSCTEAYIAGVGVALIALFALIALISAFRAETSAKSGWVLLGLLLAGMGELLAGLIAIANYSGYQTTQSIGYYYNINYEIRITAWIGFGVCAVSALLLCIRQLTLNNRSSRGVTDAATVDRTLDR